jgi:cysteine desulfurase
MELNITGVELLERIYMDSSATTRVDPAVLEAMLPYFSERYGNPSSLHSFGREAGEAMARGREQVAALMGAKPEEVIFTAGGTEADNLAILGRARRARADGKGDHVVTSNIEHPAVDRACAQLEKEGFRVDRLPVDGEGLTSPDGLAKLVGKDTVLVTIMTANNEIGTIQPIQELVRVAHEAGATFHTDAVQALGKIPVSVKELGVDMASFSSHKLHGPKGIGALYAPKGVRLSPLVFGGGHERGLRSSTENIPGIVGFGEAARIAGDMLDEEMPRLTGMRDRIIDSLLASVPECHLNGHRTRRLPNNVNVRFSYIEGEGILLRLDMEGIAVSTGSACSTRSLEPSATLLALGLSHEEAHGSVRIGLDRFNREEEVDRLLEVVPPAIKTLRAMSPLTPSDLYTD